MSYTDDNGETTYDLGDVVDAITSTGNSLDSRIVALEEHLEQIAQSTADTASNMGELVTFGWVRFLLLGVVAVALLVFF